MIALTGAAVWSEVLVYGDMSCHIKECQNGIYYLNFLKKNNDLFGTHAKDPYWRFSVQICVTLYFKVYIIQSNYLIKHLVVAVVRTWNKIYLPCKYVMEQTVLTVCNYVDVTDNYCNSYDTDRVCYTATSTLKFNLHIIYFKWLIFV